MKKYLAVGLFCSLFFCTGFLGFFEDDVVKPDKIICHYNVFNPTPSAGLSDATVGLSTGNAKADGFMGVLSFLDDLQGQYLHHTYFCTYSSKREIDKKFYKQVEKGLIKYIVFYNGLIRNTYRIFQQAAVNDDTLKSTIDYIGLLDKDNNIIRLDKVSGQTTSPATQQDFENLSKYKPE